MISNNGFIVVDAGDEADVTQLEGTTGYAPLGFKLVFIKYPTWFVESDPP
jgi:hypothetical protein